MGRRAMAGVTVAVLLLGGCGIPDNSDVTVVGPGPSTGTSSGGSGLRSRITRDSTNDRAEFVNNYLSVAAGDYDSAVERVKQFMSKDAQEGFKPPAAPRVIRLTGKVAVEPGRDTVRIPYQMLGTLGKNGLMEPSTEPETGTFELQLEEAADDGLYVRQAPPYLLLSDTALDSFYDERTIYFWNSERTGLVPDVRYLLSDVPIEQEPTIILNWLIGGPAPWLQDAVEPLPEDTKLENKVPAIRDDRLEIRLSAQAVPTEGADEAMERLRKQLQWSLRTRLPEFLELVVGHQEPRTYSGDDFLASNPAARLVPTPERYVIYDRTVRRLVESTRPSSDLVPGLAPEANKDVSRAALGTSDTHVFVALVTGSGKNERLRVGNTPLGSQTKPAEIPGLPAGMGNPVWAVTPAAGAERAFGLIIAGGRLWRFSAKGGPAQEVAWSSPSGAITAITVAPDGRRVALVVGGRLYRAVLNVSGDGMALTALEQIFSPFSTVTAVDFSGEGWLAVAGVLPPDQLISITYLSIDAALKSPVLEDMGKEEKVTYLTTYPANPITRRNNVGTVLYSTGPNAWEALSSPVQILAKELAGQVGEPRPDVVPQAPFYLN
ncbi:LpqB family beta-propeller domain-containing protein [Actinoplanes italicus]|uniref:Lipoprotein LpqB-like beta-propeller protein n=1 Tax=Actinoplanes italicus TaxID=113567 RepID=A0A2T0KPI1_9ACTN|nr:LpqB family beta-propeller domain-containing protein [Actinoplanes italicus]PRX25654.1 lipoprotein LpqB-like beta-propeller protein [Actinoplanes italicus]